jgi:hypothetical protein
MTGVRLTSWGGARRLSALQIAKMELVPKRWGPFKLADSQDILVVDCRLQVEQAALAASFQEMGQTLANLVPRKAAAGVGLPEDAGEAGQSLLVLPPQIAAAPFSCRILFPQGRWVSLTAARAVFAPGHPELQLTGGVRVASGDGASLAAATASWQVGAQKIFIEGDYTYRTGRRSLKASAGQFSLAQGRVRKVRPGAKPPLAGAGIPPPNMMAEMFTQAFSKKGRHGGEALLLPYLLAAQAGNGQPLDLKSLGSSPGALIPGPARD